MNVDKKLISFIEKHRVSVLTTLLKNGSPHSATMHYSHQKRPLKFFFSTENTSRKCEDLLDGKKTKASMIIGLSEDEMVTLQMDGIIRAIFDPKTLTIAKSVHYPKHPNSQKYENDPATIFLEFSPEWWRFTDYNTDPITIFSSETK